MRRSTQQRRHGGDVPFPFEGSLMRLFRPLVAIAVAATIGAAPVEGAVRLSATAKSDSPTTCALTARVGGLDPAKSYDIYISVLDANQNVSFERWHQMVTVSGSTSYTHTFTGIEAPVNAKANSPFLYIGFQDGEDLYESYSRNSCRG